MDTAVLEDGEIQDDILDDTTIYTPLERPLNYSLSATSKRFVTNDTQYTESEEEIQSSDSDSDSDNNGRCKKPKKVKLHPKPLRHSVSQKRYDIWSTKTQEDVLAETLNSCDVTTRDRSRDVESYDYTLARKHYRELEERQGNKRTRSNRKNVHFKPRTRLTGSEKTVKGTARKIMDLTVDINSGNQEIAKDMANKLCEEREDLILKVIETMGKKKTFEIFEETKRIEEEGGMLIMNQTRRRTPGGVFLFLVRNDYHITQEQKQQIFDEEKQRYKEMRKEQMKKKRAKKTAIEKAKILPELLTRADLLASQTQNQKSESETDERNCINPPPSPETDHHESGDGMETTHNVPIVNISHHLRNNLQETRGKLKIYDDDFLDIGCSNDMDLF